MPSYEMFTRDYAKAMLRGDKGLLKLSEVKFIQVVRYDELAVKHLYKDFMAMPNMSYYFPDRYPKGRCCDRDYMFNVAKHAARRSRQGGCAACPQAEVRCGQHDGEG